jgi:NAD(P)-dependent dehydrogenase (short-subunit alcohol dehydrogenase family)
MSTAASTGASGIIDLALAGAAVVVTGAGSGIGAATARLLGAAGASVTLVGRRQALLEQIAEAVEKTGGRAVSSSSGTLRLSGQSVYGMSKCALDYLTQSLAGELAPDRIRVNCIAPGPVDTPIHATWADDLDEAYRWLESQVPLGRIGDPADLARWIAVLLSPVSSFLTGVVLPVDGGQVIPRA